MAIQHKPWSRLETLVAFNAYCKVPLRESRSTHPLIVQYAKLIGRSPGALNMKVGNFARLDPEMQRRGVSGLQHGAASEVEIWKEFSSDPEKIALESEEIIARLIKGQGTGIQDSGDMLSATSGESVVLSKQRVGQSFFRVSVLSAYGKRCCISGIHCTSLLEACHIISWSEAPTLRVNPANSLCLNPFLHKAYDEHLISISPNYKVVISDALLEYTNENDFRQYLASLQDKDIALPSRFCPKKEFLDFHYQQYLHRNH